MDTNPSYSQQLEAINQMLLNTKDGPERDELVALKENIEELISLTEQDSNDGNQENENTEMQGVKTGEDSLDDEYATFLREMASEGAILKNDDENLTEPKETEATTSAAKFKELEGKKYRAPHKHEWGQLTYHNAMISSVAVDATREEDLEVKVLFLNPTHQEMLPCPFYFDPTKNCRFDDECKYSHGEIVDFSSLQEYVEPNFNNMNTGWEVLAKQSDNLWSRGKIAKMLKNGCLVKMEMQNGKQGEYKIFEFEDILPLNNSNNENEESDSDNDVQIIDENKLAEYQKREELINKTLLIKPEDNKPLGEWEQYTRGMGFKLMQKMGYIVGTGLGKNGEGITKPITALVLPQRKSLDFCMNLKEKLNDPNLFNADKFTVPRKIKREPRKVTLKAQTLINVEKLDLGPFIMWHLDHGKGITDREIKIVRQKIDNTAPKDINIVSFKISQRCKSTAESIEQLKIKIRRLEEKHEEPKALYKVLRNKQNELKDLNNLGLILQNTIDRRKNNREMGQF